MSPFEPGRDGWWRTACRRCWSWSPALPTRGDRQLRRFVMPVVVAATAVLVVGVSPAAAASTGGGGSLVDMIVTALKQALVVLFNPVAGLIEQHGDELVGLTLTTPQPDAVFAEPTNGPWPSLYAYYWSTIVPLSLSLYGLALGLVFLLEGTSYLFSGYHRSKLKKRAVSGLFGILSWWWMAALSLRLVNALTAFLSPDLSAITLFQTLSFTTMGVLGTAVALATDFVLFAAVAVIYVLRQVLLYLYILLMPVLIALWIPGIGPFAVVANFVKRLGRYYVPFLLMTLPIAMLFRLGDIIGAGVSLSMGGLGTWLLSLVTPVIAILSPIVFFWQASALFFIADRAGHHVDARRARDRTSHVKRGARGALDRSRSFAAGVRSRAATAGSYANRGRPDGRIKGQNGPPNDRTTGAPSADDTPGETGEDTTSPPELPAGDVDDRPASAATGQTGTDASTKGDRSEPGGDPSNRWTTLDDVGDWGGDVADTTGAGGNTDGQGDQSTTDTDEGRYDDRHL